MSDHESIISLEQQYVLQTYSRPPFVLERGEGVYLYDTEGRRFLDCVGGIAVNALGYGDPEVLAALEAQSRRLFHVSNLYHTAPQARLAQQLVEHSFADRVFFCNSGTEAVEAALKFARKWARDQDGADKYEWVAFTGSFHGRSFGALSVTAKEKYRSPFVPLVPGVRFVPYNDLTAAQAAISSQTCAVIVEPVQGEGGIHLATPEFLQGLRAACDAHNALLIFDEVQCGLGRTGYLWAHEPYGVTPDLMALAKPLGGGLPMGATLLTERVARVIAVGDHGSTFAASPLVCAVANVVFAKLSAPEFLSSIREKGQYLSERLAELQTRHPGIIEVRGRGLMWGIELSRPVKPLIEAGYQAGILLANAGDHVLRLVPPLIITKDELDQVVGILDELLTASEAG